VYTGVTKSEASAAPSSFQLYPSRIKTANPACVKCMSGVNRAQSCLRTQRILEGYRIVLRRIDSD